MTFTTPRPNFYESSECFSIEVVGRTGLVYREGGREMFIDSEVLTGPTGLVVYRDTIARWRPPHDAKAIDEAERERILQNVREAFRFQGFGIAVI